MQTGTGAQGKNQVAGSTGISHNSNIQIVDINRISLDTAFQFNVDDNWNIQGSSADVYDWYKAIYPSWWMVYPGYSEWTQVRYVDATQKAMDIVKELRDKKLLKVKNVKEFIDIVDIVRKRL